MELLPPFRQTWDSQQRGDYRVIYIGDDTTDEDAFRALRPHGITIRIGKRGRSHAKYRAASLKSIMCSKVFADILMDKKNGPSMEGPRLSDFQFLPIQ